MGMKKSEIESLILESNFNKFLQTEVLPAPDGDDIIIIKGFFLLSIKF